MGEPSKTKETVTQSLWTRFIEATSKVAARMKRPVATIAAVGAVLSGLLGYWNTYRAVQPAVAVKGSAADAPSLATDRRMSFAVLPFVAPAGDVAASAFAASTTDTLQSLVEGAYLWSRAVPHGLVVGALSTPRSYRELGTTLGVDFLFRGVVSRSSQGFAIELAVIDSRDEHAISTRQLRVDAAAGRPPALRRSALDTARGNLTYEALKREVARARQRAESTLDARDLGYRAYIDWLESDDPTLGYSTAMKSLDRAQRMSPDEPVSLYVMASMNTCECLRAWSPDIEKKEQLGMRALDRFLELKPDKIDLLVRRSQLFITRGRYEDALFVAESVLQIDPEEVGAWRAKMAALLRLGRKDDALAALAAASAVAEPGDLDDWTAAIRFATGDYAAAARIARSMLAQLSARQRSDPAWGPLALIVVAAAARQSQLDVARSALADFKASVPKASTLTAVRQWLRPTSPTPLDEAFFDALRLAGLQD